MTQLSADDIRKAWREAKSQFDPHKGYLRVEVSVSPPLEAPLGPANMPRVSNVLASRHTLEFELGYDGPDYVVTCRGVEVDRGHVNGILL